MAASVAAFVTATGDGREHSESIPSCVDWDHETNRRFPDRVLSAHRRRLRLRRYSGRRPEWLRSVAEAIGQNQSSASIE